MDSKGSPLPRAEGAPSARGRGVRVRGCLFNCPLIRPAFFGAFAPGGPPSPQGEKGQRPHEKPCGFFALAAHDGVDLWKFFEAFLPVVGWENSAVDDPGIGQQWTQIPKDARDGRMRRRGTVVANEEHIWFVRGGAGDDCLEWEIVDIGVEQRDVVAVVDQRPADGEQPKGRQHFARHARANGFVRRVDHEDAHL